MKREYEYIVLGLGGFGSAAAYWLARRAGSEVLGLEQFELGHARGESQDHSRIIRLSYHTPGYVELAKHAYGAWQLVERDAGEPLILKTGGLDFAHAGSAIPLSNYSDSMAAAGVPYETLDAAEIMRRWHPFRLDDDIRGLYQAESGIAMAARANAAHQRLAQAHGASLRAGVSVRAIRPSDEEIELNVDGATVRCRKLVITAGAWSNDVLRWFGARLPLVVTQEQVTYFAPAGLDAFRPDRFPIWIWMDDPCFYGFPVFGEQGVKAGQDAGGQEVTADTRSFEPDLAALQRVTDFLARYLPSALGPIIYTRTCLYTLTPDRDFIIDAVPGHPNAVIAIGGGHGFKFASLIGSILADLAMEGHSAFDLGPFRMDRAILQLEHPPRQYMV
ncbi:MAG TPA: N-methyl-L-tryptophan oxidase [Gemmatimonadales bacterium]